MYFPGGDQKCIEIGIIIGWITVFNYYKYKYVDFSAYLPVYAYSIRSDFF